ncbi:hypothetical protein BD414DRAFT_539835 [Trametes punicea]|nr:hypothetical protein BD414DRAFT_539835 [Trametes punicea]
MLGTFAMMRIVAKPLSKKQNTAGSDTGFWKAVETQLDELYKKYGTGDRNKVPAWLQGQANGQRVGVGPEFGSGVRVRSSEFGLGREDFGEAISNAPSYSPGVLYLQSGSRTTGGPEFGLRG